MSRRRLLSRTSLVAGSTAILGGCVMSTEPPPVTPTRPAGTRAATTATPDPSPTPTAPAPTGSSSDADRAPTMNLTDLAPALDKLAEERDCRLGIAIALGDEVDSIGAPLTGVAWSTIKVPLAMAALAEEPSDRTHALVRDAIRRSDNEAAEQLWAIWPDSRRAAEAVTAVLRKAGDDRSEVPTRRTRTGYSIFGQTEWRLADQARFALALPTLPQGKELLGHLTAVAANQQWGLWGQQWAEWDGDADPMIAVKGGWGPEPSGNHLVRQLALVGQPEVIWGASLLALPRSGRFADGTAALTAVARLLRSDLEVRASVPPTTPDRPRRGPRTTAPPPRTSR